jgi:hypothetical protein
MEIEIGKYYKRNDWCYSHVLKIVRQVDENLVIVKVNEVLCNCVDEHGNHYNGLYNNINVLFNLKDGFTEVTKEEFLSAYDEAVKNTRNKISSNDNRVLDDSILKYLHKCYKNDDNNSYGFVEDYFPKKETPGFSPYLSLCCIGNNNGKEYITKEECALDENVEQYFNGCHYGHEVSKEEYLEVFDRVSNIYRDSM